ncbi:MAG TPA: hypothetical protein VII92_05510 [Anaerolineae bacterium]
MARQKRTSPIVTKAQTRAAKLSTIDAALDLGNGLTLAAFRTKIADTQTKLDAYNAALGAVDGTNNALVQGEKELADLHERMLSAVSGKYGKDSNEYEVAGGTRKSERKKPTKRAKTAKA